MLSLEPRASDDETLESEASIGTADSSENLNVDSEGTISDFSGTLLFRTVGNKLFKYYSKMNNDYSFVQFISHIYNI